jgi:hypothetical protein
LDITIIEAASYIVPIAVSSADKVEELRTQDSGSFLSASYPGLYFHNKDTRIKKPSANEVRRLDNLLDDD